MTYFRNGKIGIGVTSIDGANNPEVLLTGGDEGTVRIKVFRPMGILIDETAHSITPSRVIKYSFSLLASVTT